MKLIRIAELVIQDKKYGSAGRHARVTEINELLGFNKDYETEVLNTSDNRYIVEYKRSRFWYDDRPITVKAILDNLNWWHVQLWNLIGNGKSRVGLAHGMVKSRFSRKKITKWLNGQARIYDKLLSK